MKLKKTSDVPINCNSTISSHCFCNYYHSFCYIKLYLCSVFTYDDTYLADTYTGTVSVRGADRFYVGNNIAYPTYSQIKNNVHGDISTREVYSRGMNDTSVITGHITIEDKWNDGSKTKVYGNLAFLFLSEAIILRGV